MQETQHEAHIVLESQVAEYLNMGDVGPTLIETAEVASCPYQVLGEVLS